MPCSLPTFTRTTLPAFLIYGSQVGFSGTTATGRTRSASSGRQAPYRSCKISNAHMAMIFVSAWLTKKPIEGVKIAPSEYTQDGVVYETNGVKVTAFEVNHGDLIKPAYGYRIDYDGRSVIISGDTRYSENLEKYAQGATLVIHEVAIANQEYYDKTPVIKYIMGHHIRPRRRVRCSRGSSLNLRLTLILSFWARQPIRPQRSRT